MNVPRTHGAKPRNAYATDAAAQLLDAVTLPGSGPATVTLTLSKTAAESCYTLAAPTTRPAYAVSFMPSAIVPPTWVHAAPSGERYTVNRSADRSTRNQTGTMLPLRPMYVVKPPVAMPY